ncbi:MAG: glycosyltransferase [Synergistaceae bacterium]|jgi:glycosyltransferase involved in cell wall biosynthesis|nr:glycosyltransferase [Synergistaceae bacterium]
MSGAPKLLITATIPETIRAFLLPYARHFRALGWQVGAMARDITKCDGLAAHFDKLFDAQWDRNPFNPSNVTKNAGLIREITASENYDIVHTHTPVASFVTRFALRQLKRKGRPAVVYTAHGFHFYQGGKRTRNRIFRALERMAGRWTDRLVTINMEDFEAAKKYGIVPEEKLAYMPGIGLDFARYDPGGVAKADIRQMRDQLGLKGDDILFSMIGEFNPGKRYADAINAFANLGHSGAHIAFAGEGPMKEKMQKLTKTLGLSKRVHFLGKLKDVAPIIMASRAILIPSEREGLSRTAMEASCLGIPIIGSNARGVRDVVQPGRGLLYPTGDIYALRDAMQQLTEEPYGSVAPDDAWRIENLIGLHENLYAELLNKPEQAQETA